MSRKAPGPGGSRAGRAGVFSTVAKRERVNGREHPASVPDEIRNEPDLEEFLTRPRPILTKFVRTLTSPLLVLGAGGKMGPTLAVLAKRAADAARHRLEVIAVSRFSDPSARRWLEERGILTVSADLLRRREVEKLPDASEIIYLVGLKFGTQQNPSLTWAVNTLVPGFVMERYPKARIAALSTGNVYPLVPARGRGAKETAPLTPVGEYANAAVARERVFDYFSRQNGTRVAMLRLNYAVELRYGVLADIAAKVFAGRPIDLANGRFNCIWQGDANEMVIRSLALADAPSTAWNLTSPRSYRVRQVAKCFGKLFGIEPLFTGEESASALLSDTRKLCAALGEPPTDLEPMIRWTAHWIKTGGRSLAKPTHFEVRDGRY